MKKFSIPIITVLLLVSLLIGSLSTIAVSQRQIKQLPLSFTHTVFIEEGTTTWCPSCPTAAEAIYNIYNSSSYPFYYVALVIDKNSVAQKQFSHYRARAIPTLFFDGGYTQQVGNATSVQQTETEYRSLIEQCGTRTIHPLNVTTNATGHGNAKLDITVTVKNTGTRLYIGILRSYVTEIVSRWKDQAGDPYHFGFLDFAINKVIILSPKQIQTFSVTWDGASQHGNLTFANISDQNIRVISTVSHWLPHLKLPETYVKTHIAFYVDEAASTVVESGD